MNSYTEEVGNKLNALLEKNYDAEKGYKKAAEHTEHTALKNYFNRKAAERYDFGHQLKSEIRNFGEKPEESGSITGTAHRTWMDVKAIFSADNEESMLEEAIRGEKASVEEYNEVLNETSLPTTTRDLVFNQKNTISQELNTIKRLEDIK
ncbi:ferritin-like domain-containing protein [Xanthomarina sp. F2636L]|uniref:ferritin-like domain-containing protein n=1 Tax=Xanthomarina sp. F2636L TaxID=2996018 RepID=UPI00225DEC2F|nr:PA2169 family four-helix-bundle protein [Xanthomarina sp. F2636L]MCX7550089.1 PA2169 family four-helix-bundle protein [Xanthomarina sp. F2636L]